MDLSLDVRKIKALTGDHGELFNQTVTEVELLEQHGELCGKVEAELQRLRNYSHDALGRLQSHVESLQVRLDLRKESCFQMCPQLEDEVRLLRDAVGSCTSQCKTRPHVRSTNDMTANKALHANLFTTITSRFIFIIQTF